MLVAAAPRPVTECLSEATRHVVKGMDNLMDHPDRWGLALLSSHERHSIYDRIDKQGTNFVFSDSLLNCFDGLPMGDLEVFKSFCDVFSGRKKIPAHFMGDAADRQFGFRGYLREGTLFIGQDEDIEFLSVHIAGDLEKEELCTPYEI